MATVYILYSQSIDSYYVGSCIDLEKRIIEHNSGAYDNSFTKRAKDWLIYYSYDLDFELARKIESHIKKMKSRKYYENLKKFPEIMQKLIEKYKG
ncbi:MAG: GIY-YIG nuclease family protein [Bacteroidales bacterium]|nr:GIY-YIG nuclease family protein [Bacteroidales bacterium]